MRFHRATAAVSPPQVRCPTLQCLPQMPQTPRMRNEPTRSIGANMHTLRVSGQVVAPQAPKQGRQSQSGGTSPACWRCAAAETRHSSAQLRAAGVWDSAAMSGKMAALAMKAGRAISSTDRRVRRCHQWSTATTCGTTPKWDDTETNTRRSSSMLHAKLATPGRRRLRHTQAVASTHPDSGVLQICSPVDNASWSICATAVLKMVCAGLHTGP
jgi:hypothetical protein